MYTGINIQGEFLLETLSGIIGNHKIVIVTAVQDCSPEE